MLKKERVKRKASTCIILQNVGNVPKIGLQGGEKKTSYITEPILDRDINDRKTKTQLGEVMKKEEEMGSIKNGSKTIEKK